MLVYVQEYIVLNISKLSFPIDIRIANPNCLADLLGPSAEAA